MNGGWRAVFALGLLGCAGAPAAWAADVPPERTALVQKLGATVPLDAAFRDETGRVVSLGDYFGRRPVVLSFAYFGCSHLCTEVLAGEAAGLAGLDPRAEAPEVITVSIDPEDTPAQAAFRRKLTGPVAERLRWHFLVGGKGAIRALTTACGFGYVADRPTHQFVHPAGLMVLTPTGRLSRYFYGVSVDAGELGVAIAGAGGGRISRPVTETLIRCFHDVFTSGRWGPWIDGALKALCLATVAGLSAFVGWMLLAERRGARPEGGAR